MKNRGVSLLLVNCVLALLVLGYGWFNAEQRIVEVRDAAGSSINSLQEANQRLTDTNEVLTVANDRLVDLKDNALAQLHKEKRLVGDKLENQFYRGVYAAAIVIVKSKGGSIDDAVKVAAGFVEGAKENKAYEMAWPGFDPVPVETEKQNNG